MTTEARINSRAFTRFLIFFLIVIIIILGLLGYQVEQRNDAIQEIQQAATRIESAATSTQQVLTDIIAEQQTPEAVAQAQRVREALEDIAVVRRMLCELPELIGDPNCR